MAESNLKENLLIKIVIPKQGKERKILPGGSEPKVFKEVTRTFRQSLSRRIEPINALIKANPNSAVPIRIELVKKATAKSHRPTQLFDPNCPIIAAGSLGELYVKATFKGLKTLNHKILTGHSKKVLKEISSINTIEPVTPTKRLNKIEPQNILKRSPKKRSGFSTKVQLFDYGNSEEQAGVLENFHNTCERIGIEVNQRGYSSKSMVFEAICKTVEDLVNLSKIDEVRNIQSMPIILVNKLKSKSTTTNITNLPIPAIPLNDYPIVAVVDSGIDPQNKYLKPWVIGQYSTVAPEYYNTEHGTNVSSLICFGKYLNPTLKGIEEYNCALFDVQVIPNDDPETGDVEELTEPEFLDTLENALKAHASKIKIWNLSIGTNARCSIDTFSSLAVELDRLQEEYNVIFVISAGNYDENPLLKYPRTGNEVELGRITSPADSSLGVTVGSI
ncbi:MAG: S8 family serine peptidase, partial [Ignavibacteria bacterium]|nr:S8 family serine peptidase [Ignavibacteria bacterium]